MKPTRGDFDRVSYWLSLSFFYAVQAATDARDEPKLRGWKRDTRDRLAMSLEAYALTIRGEDPARVRALIHELEIGREELRHRTEPYFDPVETRERHRRLARGVEESRKRMKILEGKGGDLTTEEKRELRQLRRRVESWDRDN